MEQSGTSQGGYPITIFEDNTACVTQVGAGFIKLDHVKHIGSQIFGYTQDLIQSKQIEVKKIESAHNIADMLTKALPAYTHRGLYKRQGWGSSMNLFLHKLHSFLALWSFSWLMFFYHKDSF